MRGPEGDLPDVPERDRRREIDRLPEVDAVVVALHLVPRLVRFAAWFVRVGAGLARNDQPKVGEEHVGDGALRSGQDTSGALIDMAL